MLLGLLMRGSSSASQCVQSSMLYHHAWSLTHGIWVHWSWACGPLLQRLLACWHNSLKMAEQSGKIMLCVPASNDDASRSGVDKLQWDNDLSSHSQSHGMTTKVEWLIWHMITSPPCPQNPLNCFVFLFYFIPKIYLKPTSNKPIRK